MAVTRINKKQMSELDKEYEASLKSIETENKIDRIFYRPIGFRIARMLRGTGITPNMITVISIFVGAAVGFMFYHDNLTYNICGILLLVFANIPGESVQDTPDSGLDPCKTCQLPIHAVEDIGKYQQ